MKKIYKSEIPKFTEFSDFVYWYCKDGAKFYLENSVYSTIQIGSKTSESIVFSHGQYQVEMYNINLTDDFFIDSHCHPNVRTFEWFFYPQSSIDGNSFDINNKDSIRECITEPGNYHGGNGSPLNTPNYLLFVLQEWTIDYKGHISILDYVGPSLSEKHENLIYKYNKAALTTAKIENKTGHRLIVDTSVGGKL